MIEALVDAYTDDLLSDDPLRAAVARHQLEQLRARSAPRPASDVVVPPSRWAHVPLAALFEAEGNTIMRQRSNGDLETGHEPWHGSKSGGCVLIQPASGRWWCRSCRRRGDAASFVMDLHGCSYDVAADMLASRFGPPTGQRPPASRRPTFEVF